MTDTQSRAQGSAQQLTEAVDDLDPAAWGALENLGRAFHVRNADLSDTLVAVLAEAASLTDDVQHAGINLWVKHRFEPQAVLGAAPPPLDQLQERSNKGPCIDASRDQKVVRVTDMRNESRWPEFVALADQLGIRAMLCLPLWVDDHRLGSLSLYSENPRGFDDRTTRVAGLLATHAALALSDALRTDSLSAAIRSRDVIGQAKGILMERLRITAEDAFARLVSASQSGNRKLADIATEFVQTGSLPERGGAQA